MSDLNDHQLRVFATLGGSLELRCMLCVEELRPSTLGVWRHQVELSELVDAFIEHRNRMAKGPDDPQ